MFSTGTLAVVGILSGTGLVIAGTQIVSGVTGSISEIAAQNGYHNVAAGLKVVSEVTDLHSHVKKLWDAGINTYQNPQAALQKTVDFVEQTTHQVKDAAHDLYTDAKEAAQNVGGWLWSKVTGG